MPTALLALLAIALPLAVGLPLATGSDALAVSWETPGLTPLPGSAAETRLHQHQAEAARRPPPASVAPELSWVAADFQSLGTPPWLIEHQDITVDLNAAKSVLDIQIDVTVTANKKTSELYFLIGGVKTVTMERGGVALDVENQAAASYSLLTVPLPEPMTAGTQETFHLVAQAILDCSPVGIGLRPCGVGGKYNYVTFFNYYLSSGDQQHAPFKSTLHVVTPAGQMAAAPGLPLGSDKLADGRSVWHFEQKERTDNAGFSIALYKPADAKLETGAPLRLYVTETYTKYVNNMRDLTVDVVKWYGARFGAFPWPSLNIIQVENNFGGGYAPLSGVFMYRDVFAGEPNSGMWSSVVELSAHEFGHQWWGNLVEPTSSGDVALSESLAEYSSCAYTEATLGNRGQMIRNSISYMYLVPSKGDVAVSSQSVYSSPYYVQIIYYKGAVVFDMLRHLLGPEVMDKGLALFVKKYSRDYAKVDDLRAAMEEAAGRKLDWFWQQWLVKKGFIHAELAGRVLEEEGKFKLRLRITQPIEKILRFVVPVSIDYRDGTSAEIDVEVLGKEAEFITELVSDQRPVRVRFDLQRTQLRKFSTGTPGDFNLTGLVDGADLVELALRHGRAVTVKGKNGTDHFFADTAWNELYDLSPDGRVDDADVEALDQWVGTVAEEF